MFFFRLSLILALFFQLAVLWAQEDIPTSQPATQGKTLTQNDLQIEMMKLELQKCQLENEKLQLEMDRLRLQGGSPSVSAPTPAVPDKGDIDNKKGGIVNLDASAKAEELAKENKDNTRMIIFDTENCEVWIGGTRYPLFELRNVMQDLEWKYKSDLVTTQPNGNRRFKYSYKNISLEKYENENFGIFTIEKPKDDQDFQMSTVEGIGLDAPESDVRNLFQNKYFHFEGEERQDKTYDLKYKHEHGLFGWDDKIDFVLDKKNHLLIEMKYGVLDEH